MCDEPGVCLLQIAHKRNSLIIPVLTPAATRFKPPKLQTVANDDQYDYS
jgi:hypothetical protein